MKKFSEYEIKLIDAIISKATKSEDYIIFINEIFTDLLPNNYLIKFDLEEQKVYHNLIKCRFKN